MLMETMKYMMGSAGPTGFGSTTTAADVTAAAPLLSSITAIITGATSGIGFETARALAAAGARLILPVRNPAAGEQIKSRIVGGEIFVLSLDLSSLSSVRSFVAQFIALGFPLNILINNAGIFAYDEGRSEDGIELTFATNYLGHFLMTKLLLNKMVESATETGIEGRILNVSSNSHRWYSDDPIVHLRLLAAGELRYNALRAYGLSKLAMVMHAKELSKRIEKFGANLTVNCVDPGIARTRLNRDREGFVLEMMFFLASKFVKSVSQAAATLCYAAAHPAAAGATGKYYSDCNVSAASMTAENGEAAARLWRETEALVAEVEENVR